MYELFIELTDQIYWEGYAFQLAKEHPERFLAEYQSFLKGH